MRLSIMAKLSSHYFIEQNNKPTGLHPYSNNIGLSNLQINANALDTLMGGKFN